MNCENQTLFSCARISSELWNEGQPQRNLIGGFLRITSGVVFLFRGFQRFLHTHWSYGELGIWNQEGYFGIYGYRSSTVGAKALIIRVILIIAMVLL